MERYLYIVNGRVIEYAGVVSNRFRITDSEQITLYDANKTNPMLYFDTQDNLLKLATKSLEQLKAEKQNEILQGFENAKTVKIKVLTARDLYSPVVDFVVDRVHKLTSLRNDIIELGQATKETFQFAGFNGYDANGNELNNQVVNYLEVSEIAVTIGMRLTSLETQRNTYLTALTNATTEAEINAINVSYV